VKELHDKELFTQPDESYPGECPICFLPMPVDPKKALFKTCCSALICMGCVYADLKRNAHDKEKALRCQFCREPHNDDKGEEEKNKKRMMKRVKANDPRAIREMGMHYLKEGDDKSAFEYLTKAAELGDVKAHYQLGLMYYYGEGKGVEKDEGKAVYHYEKAAIGGHPEARHNLAAFEGDNGRMERSVKHFIISANLGCEFSMKELWKHYSLGNITKEELDATLRAHQAALDEMKSEQRDAAARAKQGHQEFLIQKNW
jgi:hypothetical protein